MESWTLNPHDVSLKFTGRGMWGLLPVSGSFTEANGAIEWQSDFAGTVHVDVSAASIDTGNAFRDRHLRSASFLDAAQHPSITFAGSATRTPSAIRLVGVLTVRGQESEQVVTVLTSAGPTVAGSASLTIDLANFGIRPAFGMTRPQVRLDLAGSVL